MAALVRILRMKPYQINLIISQVGNASISDVILSLRSNVTPSLNENCPVCPNSAGLLNNVPCYNCKGYGMIHTQNGQEQPPVNPFEQTISTILLPCDFIQSLAFLDVTNISDLIPKLQSNYLKVPTNNCPLCNHTGIIQNTCSCYLCNGVGKTAIPYIITNGKITKNIIAPVPPNPIPPPSSFPLNRDT